MPAGPPYARVYFSIWEDERFSEIVADDALLGAWLRLLLLAEAAWPQSVAIPRSVPRRTLRVLAGSGVIELHPADTYRIHGLDPERQRRSKHGRDAVLSRYSRGTTPGTTPSSTQTLLAPRPRTSSDSEGGVQGGDDAAIAWLAVHHASLEPNGNGLHRKLCRLVEVHGSPAVVRAFDDLLAEGRVTEARQYIFGADDRLNPLPSTRRNGHESHDYLPSIEEAENAFEHYE